MKKKIRMGKMLLSILALSATMMISSCKQEPKPDDTKESAEELNDVATANDSIGNAKEHDSDYLIAAAETNMIEIELGKLALSKTANAKVKELANMMIDEHTKASEKLIPFAQTKEIILPSALTDKGKEHYEDLNKKSGKEFDEAYAEMMVKGHEEAIENIKDAADKAKDADIRKWAVEMLPTLNTHLGHSKAIEEQINKSK